MQLLRCRDASWGISVFAVWQGVWPRREQPSYRPTIAITTHRCGADRLLLRSLLCHFKDCWRLSAGAYDLFSCFLDQSTPQGPPRTYCRYQLGNRIWLAEETDVGAIPLDGSFSHVKATGCDGKPTAYSDPCIAARSYLESDRPVVLLGTSTRTGMTR